MLYGCDQITRRIVLPDDRHQPSLSPQGIEVHCDVAGSPGLVYLSGDPHDGDGGFWGKANRDTVEIPIKDGISNYEDVRQNSSPLL